MTQNSEVSMPMSASTGQTTCSNCHSMMPSDLRFCRNCGFRLADGSGGFTGRQFNEVTAGATSAPLKKRRRMSGMSWIFVGLLIFFVGAAAFTALVAPMRQGTQSLTSAPVVKSYVGVDEFEDSDEGLILNYVSVPEGPADKAGLVGGDIVLSVDGQPIQNEDQMEDLMIKTPVGKTIEIEYSRDGEKKSSKLTTISQEEFQRLRKEFERRPEGKSVFGYEDDDARRVPIPGTKMHGVQLRRILLSRPADLAGIKENDIVTEFDGVPIRTSDEFLMRVKRALPYSTVKVVVMRGGEVEGAPLEKVEIPVKMGKQ